jgi:CheY-like chemotaxis protein
MFVRLGGGMPAVALVVDDSMVIRHTVSRFLEERGFAVESASNGMEALEILKRVKPALVITDMQMPAMSGSELISALKNKPETASIPILILTGVSSGFDRKESRAEFTIFKDIDVQEQLEKALAAVAGKAAKSQGSGK